MAVEPGGAQLDISMARGVGSEQINKNQQEQMTNAQMGVERNDGSNLAATETEARVPDVEV